MSAVAAPPILVVELAISVQSVSPVDDVTAVKLLVEELEAQLGDRLPPVLLPRVHMRDVRWSDRGVAR